MQTERTRHCAKYHSRTGSFAVPNGAIPGGVLCHSCCAGWGAEDRYVPGSVVEWSEKGGCWLPTAMGEKILGTLRRLTVPRGPAVGEIPARNASEVGIRVAPSSQVSLPVASFSSIDSERDLKLMFSGLRLAEDPSATGAAEALPLRFCVVGKSSIPQGISPFQS